MRRSKSNDRQEKRGVTYAVENVVRKKGTHVAPE